MNGLRYCFRFYNNSTKYRKLSSRAKLSPIADVFNYGQPQYNSKLIKTTGLFNKPELINPKGFQFLTDESIQKCYELLNEAISSDRKRKMVQVLDDISDELCRVADMADCMRMIHPDELFRKAAADACHQIGPFVEQLNTNADLYSASIRARDGSLCQLPVDRNMDTIDKRVLDLFIADFELSGVQLKDPSRHNQFVKNASDAMRFSSQFVQTCHTSVRFPPDNSDSVLFNSPESFNFGPVNLFSPIVHPNLDIRKGSYQTYYAPMAGQEYCLENFLNARHAMARAAGFNNYAERTILHSLAESPANVYRFLTDVCQALRPIAAETTRTQLMPIFQQFYDQPTHKIFPWDLLYTLNLKRKSFQANTLSDYFSLGACMEGVTQLAHCLFDLKLKIEPTEIGELWHPDVIKVGVYADQSNELVGTVYCDLMDRTDKPAQDCHFTIRGGRCVVDQAGAYAYYQSPIITLQLTLDPSTSPSGAPPLLTLSQVETFFHEWGHALHSMVARTKYQHVTGTRCSTDLAELPSTLFERFALDSRVAKEYARHWLTGKALDAKQLETVERLRIVRNLGESLQMSQQISYALFDHTLHSNSVEQTLWSLDPTGVWPASARLLAHIQHTCGMSDWYNCSVDHVNAWPHRFAHLVNYGGKYYAYIMARAGADLVWTHCFARDPWSFSQGRLFVDELLSHGGEYHPATMLSNLLSPADSNRFGSAESTDLLSSKLAQSLIDRTTDNESTVCSLLDRMTAPGLHQPKSIHF